MNKKVVTCFLLLTIGAIQAQTDTSMQSEWPTIQIPDEVQEAQAIIDAWEEEQFGYEQDSGEEVYRTSEQPKERATSRGGRLGYPSSYEQVEGGMRTGCICMDGTRQNERGRGACSGRGGVRHWIYRMSDGAEVLYATPRHYDHPAELNKVEVSNLSVYNEDQKTDGLITIRTNSLYEWATALAVCSIMALFFRHLYLNTEYLKTWRR